MPKKYQPPENIQQILANLPTSPGVYQMIDEAGKIIYIGKAKNLRNRVRSYFQPANHDRKVLKIRYHVRDIQIIVLETEVMALTVEAQLIRTHKPRYNVIWKDDKRYPYIIVKTGDAYPKVELTRQVDRHDGHRYFGPFSSGWTARSTLDVLRKAFPYLTCDRKIDGNDARACLYYDIKLCGGPCIGAQTQAEYRTSLQGLMDVLDGRGENIVNEMQAQMESAAENLDFEKAAMLRDQILAIKRATRSQTQIATIGANQDVINIAQQEGDALIQLFIVRSGYLIASESFPLTNIDEDDTSADMLAAFITQFYEGAYEIPPEILLPESLPDQDILTQWLSEIRDKKATLIIPQRGEKRKLVKQAGETALEQLTIFQAQWQQDTHKQESALGEIQTALGLETPPNRIECYDISTMQGTATVASRVVFIQGTPEKSEYRRYNIKTIDHAGSDDYQSMREVLTRRFRRYVESVEADNAELPPGKRDKDETWRLLPDLLIVDGGKGQLGVAVEVLESYGLLEHVPVVGLAKRFEELYKPGEKMGVRLPRNTEGLFLVQRIRDEAHRFAISGHRARRTKKGLASRLDSIQGIGPAKRRALLKAFDNNIDAIQNASVDELMQVSGISAKIAEQIKQSLM